MLLVSSRKLRAEVGEPRERLSEDGREKSGKCLYVQVFERTCERAGTFVRRREIWVIRRTGVK